MFSPLPSRGKRVCAAGAGEDVRCVDGTSAGCKVQSATLVRTLVGVLYSYDVMPNGISIVSACGTWSGGVRQKRSVSRQLGHIEGSGCQFRAIYASPGGGKRCTPPATFPTWLLGDDADGYVEGKKQLRRRWAHADGTFCEVDLLRSFRVASVDDTTNALQSLK